MLHVTLLRIQCATTATDIYDRDCGKFLLTPASFACILSMCKNRYIARQRYYSINQQDNIRNVHANNHQLQQIYI